MAGIIGVSNNKALFEVHCDECETPWVEEVDAPKGFSPKGILVLGPIAVPKGFIEELMGGRDFDQPRGTLN